MALACLSQASVNSGVSGPLGGSSSQVECRVEDFPWGALAACEAGGFEESLPAPLGVFRLYFGGLGFRHEERVCPVEDPP